MSVVAITIGGLIIVPPFVLLRHWQADGVFTSVADAQTGSGVLFFVLSIIPIASLFAPVYLQRS